MYQYFIKVVPTIYEYIDTRKPRVDSNQYSVTDYKRELEGGARPSSTRTHDAHPSSLSYGPPSLSVMIAINITQRSRGPGDVIWPG
jgi:hypothetical protein